MKTFKKIPSYVLPYSPIGQVGEPLHESGIFIMEIWKTIPGYELYEASNTGKIRSKGRIINRLRHGKICQDYIKPKLVSCFYRKGYLLCHIWNGKEFVNRSSHRLILSTFVKCDDYNMDVNHKNGIKDDNRLENLEWCTRSENIKHAWDNGLRQVPEYNGHSDKPCMQLTMDGKLIKIFKSIADAARELNINQRNISTVILKSSNRHSAGGYKWESIQTG